MARRGSGGWPLRRINTDDDDEEDDVPAPVELLLLASQVPLLRELTTAQIAALVERTEVVDLASGDVLYAGGERIEALIVVTERAGALVAGDRRITAGHALDELAPLAPRASTAGPSSATGVQANEVQGVDRRHIESPPQPTPF